MCLKISELYAFQQFCVDVFLVKKLEKILVVSNEKSKENFVL
jgi:hypothetical protein